MKKKSKLAVVPSIEAKPEPSLATKLRALIGDSDEVLRDLADDLDIFAQAMAHQRSRDAVTVLPDEAIESAAVRLAIRARHAAELDVLTWQLERDEKAVSK